MSAARDFLAGTRSCALVRVAEARGSTPREAGAWMLVAPDAVCGTIGGGQLEYLAIDAARALLAGDGDAHRLDVPLGPEIGQCCGGRVALDLLRLDDAARARFLDDLDAARAAEPRIWLFGAGHVGRALAAALSLLPVRPVLIDGRAEELALAPPGVETRLTPLPEAVVRDASPGDSFVVLTHDHALDFLIAREALERRDAGYVGMIGSRTKRRQFERFCRDEGTDPAPLVCPIGASRGSSDKRPEVIAAFVSAEIMALVSEAALETTGA